MLVINRRVSEQVVIDTGNGFVTVTIDDIRPGSVRLSVQAPDDMVIRLRLMDSRKPADVP